MTLSRHLLLCLGLALALPGCDASSAWPLPSPTFFPTALDYWRGADAFLVGSYGDGSVVRIAASGKVEPALLQARGPAQHRRILRLKVDDARARLWVLDRDGLSAHSLPSAELLKRVALPRFDVSRDACLPDLALDASGNAFVSDNERFTLYRVDARSLALSRLPLHAGGATQPEGLSALAPAPAAGTLLAGSAITGRLWLIDVRSGKALRIAHDARIRGICGLSAAPAPQPPQAGRERAAVFYATTGFAGGLARIELACGRGTAPTAVRISGVGRNHVLGTPTSLYVSDATLLVASSQLDSFNEIRRGPGVSPLIPFRILVIPREPQMNAQLIWGRGGR